MSPLTHTMCRREPTHQWRANPFPKGRSAGQLRERRTASLPHIQSFAQACKWNRVVRKRQSETPIRYATLDVAGGVSEVGRVLSAGMQGAQWVTGGCNCELRGAQSKRVLSFFCVFFGCCTEVGRRVGAGAAPQIDPYEGPPRADLDYVVQVRWHGRRGWHDCTLASSCASRGMVARTMARAGIGAARARLSAGIGEAGVPVAAGALRAWEGEIWRPQNTYICMIMRP